MASQFQPTEEQIDAVASVTNLPREECIQRLKGNNNNVEQAIGEYFDDPDGSSKKYRWDETQFSSDREGTQNNHGISFDIHAPDDHGPYNSQFNGGAPSRPPSRTSHNKSPHQIIDLTAEHAAADPSMSIGFDPDLQQALAASRAEAGMSPQETGVTGTDQVFFGPATRPQNEYESGNWGMVTLGKSAVQDILMDPEPAYRVRQSDAPAFLKPEHNHLAGLITIYHEIPVTRNLFLNIQDSDIHFGYDAQWWTGQSISLAPGLSPEEEAAQSGVDRELQRLMAFLDKTERSYGSVQALTNNPDVQQCLKRKGDRNVEAAVLDAWRQKFEPQKMALVRQIFSTGVDSENEETVQDFAILELQLPPKNSMQETFYDMADEILWPNLGAPELSQSPYLSRIGEVIAFAIDCYGGQAVDIPLIWYPDRYLKSAREKALEMRLKKRQVREELERIDKLEDRLTHAPLRSGKIITMQELFKAVMRHSVHDTRPPSQASLTLDEELPKLLANIEKKLLSLNEEKEKARATFRELSKLYTEPSEEPDAPKLHKYTLRGVSTGKTMYICRRAEPDLIDMTDGEELAGPKDQWWRINYATSGERPVTLEQTTESNVLEAAKNESRQTMLVYASEKAMNYPIQALPKKLETFVKWENTNFKSEFRAIADVPAGNHTIIGDTQPVGLSSPGKRKFQESSLYNQDYGVKISERELRNSDGSSDWDAGPNGSIPASDSPRGKDEVLIGIDPSLLSKDGMDGFEPRTQANVLPMELSEDSEAKPGEMAQLNSIPMLTNRTRPEAKGNSDTIDSMDLDQVVVDNNMKEESAAVKHVGFVD